MPSIYVASQVLDAGLSYIVANTNRIVACSAYPTSYADVAARTLGSKTITPAAFTGPVAQSEEDTYGREVRLAAFSDGSVSVTGTAVCWCLVDDVADRRLLIREAETPQAMTAGTAWGIPGGLIIAFPAFPDEA